MISYEPLRILLTKEKRTGLNMRKLIDDGVITPNISVKLNNDTGYVNLSTIDKVANYLTQRLGRVVTIQELIRFVPDKIVSNKYSNEPDFD